MSYPLSDLRISILGILAINAFVHEGCILYVIYFPIEQNRNIRAYRFAIQKTTQFSQSNRLVCGCVINVKHLLHERGIVNFPSSVKCLQFLPCSYTQLISKVSSDQTLILLFNSNWHSEAQAVLAVCSLAGCLHVGSTCSCEHH